MWVKVDYSIEAKKNPHPNMGGMWAIYTIFELGIQQAQKED